MRCLGRLLEEIDSCDLRFGWANVICSNGTVMHTLGRHDTRGLLDRMDETSALSILS
jgi:hypothetical protein